jgi:hypothetical protein
MILRMVQTQTHKTEGYCFHEYGMEKMHAVLLTKVAFF